MRTVSVPPQHAPQINPSVYHPAPPGPLSSSTTPKHPPNHSVRPFHPVRQRPDRPSLDRYVVPAERPGPLRFSILPCGADTPQSKHRPLRGSALTGRSAPLVHHETDGGSTDPPKLLFRCDITGPEHPPPFLHANRKQQPARRHLRSAGPSLCCQYGDRPSLIPSRKIPRTTGGDRHHPIHAKHGWCRSPSCFCRPGNLPGGTGSVGGQEGATQRPPTVQSAKMDNLPSQARGSDPNQPVRSSFLPRCGHVRGSRSPSSAMDQDLQRVLTRPGTSPPSPQTTTQTSISRRGEGQRRGFF